MCLEGNGDSAFNTLTPSTKVSQNGGASKKYSVKVFASIVHKVPKNITNDLQLFCP